MNIAIEYIRYMDMNVFSTQTNTDHGGLIFRFPGREKQEVTDLGGTSSVRNLFESSARRFISESVLGKLRS
jgi:hypothetical protein